MKKYSPFIRIGLVLTAGALLVLGSAYNHVEAACPNLFWHTTVAGNSRFYLSLNQAFDSTSAGETGGIEEYLQSDGVSMSVKGDLPPGLRLISYTVNYPRGNMNNDGIDISSYVNADIKKGFPPLTRYAFAGRPTQKGTWTVNLSASKGSSCTGNASVEVVVSDPNTPPPPPPKPGELPLPPASKNGKISFSRIVLYADSSLNAGTDVGVQKIVDMETWGKKGDKFVLSGDYGGSLENVPLNGIANRPGGGLWTVAEDGSKFVERQAALDAGGQTNSIYHHGIRNTSYSILYEWGSGGFVMDNASSGGCVDFQGNDIYCTQYDTGALKSVFYKQGSNGYPIVGGTSAFGPGRTIAVLAGKAISGDSVVSLPRWGDMGSADLEGIGTVILTFGDNIINDQGEVFHMSSDGTVDDTGKKLQDDGWSWPNLYSWDWSNGFPPKLAIWERQIQGDSTYGAVTTASKIKVFKLSGGNIVLDKTMDAPLNPLTDKNNQAVLNGFGMWGNYLVTPGFSAKIGDTIKIWQGNKLIDEVALPAGAMGFNGRPLAISKNGYVLVNAAPTVGIAPRSMLLLLYKLNLTPNTVTPPPPPPATTCQDPAADNYKIGLPCHYPPAGPPITGSGNGKCTATLTFDKSSVAYGGSITENWEIDGADLGQTYADCGSGETTISAGPKSNTIDNLNTPGTFTCRVYGMVNGAEGCSATASATIGARPSPGGGGPKNPDMQTSASAAFYAPISSGATLKEGSSGSDVVALQQLLNNDVNANLTPDGKFGAKTKVAVISWQRAHNLTADGVVGPKTREAMNL